MIWKGSTPTCSWLVQRSHFRMREYKKAQDLTGRRFGRLVVSELVEIRQYTGTRAYIWRCQCDCGAQSRVASGGLTQGRISSCGCWNREINRTLHTKHGHCARRSTGETSEYRSWRHMVERCENPSEKRYASYGGRGIKVCDRWKNNFSAFLADMGQKPSPKHSIDRKDNDLGYEPGNCRWATPKQQAHNRRPFRNRFGTLVTPRGYTE
jgi:hypothetical protein